MTKSRAFSIALCVVLLSWLVAEHDALRNWGDDVRLYASTVRNYPENIEARLNLASMYVARERSRDAAPVLEQAVALAPANRTVIRAYFDMLGDVKPANEILDFASKHAADLDTPDLLFKRGTLLVQVERYEEALPLLRQAVENADDAKLRLAAGYRLLLALIVTDRNVEAVSLVDRLLREYPERPELLIAKQRLAGYAH